MDAGGDDSAGPDSERAEDLYPECQTRKLRFSGLHFWAALLVENRQVILGSQTVQEGDPAPQEGVYEMLRPCENDRWEDVRDRLNAKLREWQNYFRYGSLNKAYRIVDGYVYQCVRHFLRRCHHAKNSRGTRPFSAQVVYGERGVHRFQRA